MGGATCDTVIAMFNMRVVLLVSLCDADTAAADDDDDDDVVCTGTHHWSHRECMICTVCEECTGYGSSCVSSAHHDDRVPGQYVHITDTHCHSSVVCTMIFTLL